MSIERIVHLALPPTLVRTREGDEARREAERHQRAMPLTRLLGNGMEYSDALRLHALAAEGYEWDAVGEWLGDRNRERGERALAAGHRVSARGWFRHATACYRFAQSAFPTDVERKGALYVKLTETFGRAIALDEPPGERVEIPFRGSRLCAWLLRPVAAKPPVVIVIGGADGWREEYQEGARHLLERGVAVLLAELPGQGETRLLRGLYLDANPDAAVSAIIDFLHADARLAPRVGIWGNSMGGAFAALAASREPRLAACCANGGTATPAEVIERFPRIVEKLDAMTGPAPALDAPALMEALAVTGERNRVRCPLLVVHGDPDRIFLVENAQRLHDEAPSDDKRMLVWDDGEHCIYNHSHEKHTLIADWFAERLGAEGSSGGKA